MWTYVKKIMSKTILLIKYLIILKTIVIFKMKNKKILVTGGAGYIGSHCVISLVNSGYHPIVIDNFCNSKKTVFKKIKQITKKNIKYYYLDLRDKKKLNQVFKKHKFQSVFHFAGLKSVPESNKEPLSYFNNNITGSLSLFECMKENKVFKIIFSSSACVYNVDEKLPWSEKTNTGHTTNSYGLSKYIIERILMDLSKLDERWKIGIARYFNPIGNHYSGIIGEETDNKSTNLIPSILKVIKKDWKFIDVHGNDYRTKDGTGVRDYIHVMDLVDAHVKILKYLKKVKTYEIFNLGSGKGYSVKDILKAFSKNDIKIPYKVKPRRKGDLGVYYTSNTKVRNLLKWSPQHNLNSMIKDICKFIYK